MHISTVNAKFMFPPLNKKVDQPYMFWKILCKFMLKHASHDFKVFMTRSPLTVSLCFALTTVLGGFFVSSETVSYPDGSDWKFEEIHGVAVLYC